jgi:hypothetical protein
MKRLFSCLSFLVPFITLSQIKVMDVGDGWKDQVNYSLTIIKSIDSVKWKALDQYCDEIGYWNGNYSTSDGTSVIFISTREMRYGDLENIAAILVHESMHLFIANSGIKLDPNVEEVMCYSYELEFLKKMEAKQSLIDHAKNMISYYSIVNK